MIIDIEEEMKKFEQGFAYKPPIIVDCVSDLHGSLPKLEGGDVLIIAGDITARGTQNEYFTVFDWINEQKYEKKILIAGNHDTLMEKQNYQGPQGVMKGAFDYLCDSGTEFRGLKLWGSPWTKTFEGQNPEAMAFSIPMGCDQDEWLEEKWAMIPKDTDILVTHSPPYGILDGTIREERVGSKSLRKRVEEIHPKLHVFGHIHEGHGKDFSTLHPTMCVNAAIMTRYYTPKNHPIRIAL